jgi:hypothetical protein
VWRFCWGSDVVAGSARGVRLWWHLPPPIVQLSPDPSFWPLSSTTTSISSPDASVSSSALEGRLVVSGGGLLGNRKVVFCPVMDVKVFSSSSPRSRWLFMSNRNSGRHGGCSWNNTNLFFDEWRRDLYCLGGWGQEEGRQISDRHGGSKKALAPQICEANIQMFRTQPKNWVERLEKYGIEQKEPNFLLVPMSGYNSR